MARVAMWFSCGGASAVTAKMMIAERHNDLHILYCDTRSEHEDSERFLTDCERWWGRSVTRLKSQKFSDTWDVWQKRRYLAGIDGAPCTMELKVAPRLEWQQPDDIHVFGYTCDGPDIERAKNLRENYPDLQIRTPLIDKGITKASCLDMVQRAGIKLPPLYELGFQNNNCIPCVKATSPAYWALVRKCFPDKFWRMAKLSRALDVRLCRINGERAFIDEIPEDHPTTDPIQPACDFLCQLAEQEFAP